MIVNFFCILFLKSVTFYQGHTCHYIKKNSQNGVYDRSLSFKSLYFETLLRRADNKFIYMYIITSLQYHLDSI